MKWYRDSGYVYVIKQGTDNIYKIGITRNNPYSRMSELQTGNPFKLSMVKCYPVLDSQEIERILHCIYASYRLEGAFDTTDCPRCAHLLSADEITDALLFPTTSAINESFKHNQLDKTRENTITNESLTNV